MPAAKDNQYATKDDADKRSVRLMVSFTPAQKQTLNASHRGRGKLTDHVAKLALAAIAAGIDPEEE